MTKTSAFIFLSAFIAAAGSAAAEEPIAFEAGGMGLPALTNDAATGVALQPDAFSFAPQREWSMNLGRGFSIATYSGPSDPFGSAFRLDAPNTFLTDLHSNMAPPQSGAYFGHAYDTVPGNYGARVSMDLGSGVSFNVMGGLSKMMDVGSFTTPGLGLSMTPQSMTSAHLGGGFSMDLGRGSSLSLVGSVSKTTGCSMPVGMCR